MKALAACFVHQMKQKHHDRLISIDALNSVGRVAQMVTQYIAREYPLVG
jgi:hypothetical protein